MKTLIIALTALFALGNAVSAQTTATATPKKEAQKTMYSCPMHPKEVSGKKGKCPKCGMDLVANKETVHHAAKESKTPAVAKNKYVCTMDGSTSDKPGKCPKCGMKMTEKKEVGKK